MLAILQLSTGNSPILKASQSCVKPFAPQKTAINASHVRASSDIVYTKSASNCLAGSPGAMAA
jgi:hypothetical protein